MEVQKKYRVPEELMNIMAEYLALCNLRDTLVKYRFRFKKARKCAVEAEILRARFWKEVQILHPATKGKEMDYDRGGYVRIIEKVDEN